MNKGEEEKDYHMQYYSSYATTQLMKCYLIFYWISSIDSQHLINSKTMKS